MSKYISRLFLTGIAILWISNMSCKKSFLDQPPVGSLSKNLVSTPEGVNALLIGAYGALDGSSIGFDPWVTTPMNWIFGDVAGGDAHKGAEGGDQSSINSVANFSIDPSNGILSDKWTACYEGVTRCNDVISVLGSMSASAMPVQQRTNILAQARFLRGHFYFELKKLFNKVPWIDESTTDRRQPNDKDIWGFIVADFKYAFDNLPPLQDAVGKANKWAAGAYLGKAYLYQHKYSDAKPVFDLVIANGLTSNGLKYGLMDDFYKAFYAEWKNSKESVFAVQMSVNDGTGDITNANNGNMLNFPFYSPFRCCGFYQPTQDLVNCFKTNPATGLPYLDNYNVNPVKNDMNVAGNQPFVPYSGTVDPRLDWTVGRRGIPYLDWGVFPGKSWVRDQSYGGPYFGKKNIYWQGTQNIYSDQSSWAPGTANNVNIIRFADVLLMAAEVEAEVGSLDKAQEYVDFVRTRAARNTAWVHTYINESYPLAGNTAVPAANYLVSVYPAGRFMSIGKTEAKKAIYFERRLELALEGHRFFDLVRWGVAGPVLNEYLNYEGQITTDIKGARFNINRNEYFPIPQIQIDRSVQSNGVSALTQNQGYN